MLMATFEIRPASVADAELIMVLGARTFRDTYRPISAADELEDYIAENFTLAKIEAQLRDPDACMFLGYVDDRIVGYAHLRIVPAPACVVGPSPVEISRLYLDSASKGAGHGSAFMRALLDQARQWDRETVWLGVYEENRQARTFYTGWGFKDVGTHEFMFGGRVYSDPVMSRAVRDDACVSAIGRPA